MSLDSLRIEFPYLRFSKNDEFRPFIPISIHYKKGTERTLALLDSGADFTFIPLKIARRVGLSLSPKRVREVHGVGGIIDAYMTHATLIFYLGEKQEFVLNKVPVLVSDDENFKYNLLGRDSIFNEFIISFDEYDKKVTFERKFH